MAADAHRPANPFLAHAQAMRRYPHARKFDVRRRNRNRYCGAWRGAPTKHGGPHAAHANSPLSVWQLASLAPRRVQREHAPAASQDRGMRGVRTERPRHATGYFGGCRPLYGYTPATAKSPGAGDRLIQGPRLRVRAGTRDLDEACNLPTSTCRTNTATCIGRGSTSASVSLTVSRSQKASPRRGGSGVSTSVPLIRG